MLRRPEVDDVPEIEDIAKEYSNNELVQEFESAAVVESETGIIAFAVLRSDLEAILYCKGNNKDLVQAIKLLIEQSHVDAKSLKFKHIYTFAESEEFAGILEKHFHFKRIPKIPMILDLE